MLNRYYTSSGYQKSNSLFGGGGKKAFAVGAGAGFLGGAVAAAGAMSVYHRYQMYKAMMHYRGYGYGNYYSGYGNYGYGYGFGHSPMQLLWLTTRVLFPWGECPKL